MKGQNVGNNRRGEKFSVYLGETKVWVKCEQNTLNA